MNVLQEIQSLYFTNDFIKDKEKQYTLLNCLHKSNSNSLKKNKLDISKPVDMDCITHNNIFWFIFIMVNGIEEYELLRKKTTIETKLRYNLIEVMQKKDFKTILKTHKLKIDEIVNDLGNIGNITIDTFKALCVYYKINYCLKNKNICEINKNVDNDSYFMIEGNTMYLQKKTLDNIKQSYYIVDSITKPFKSISTYKVADLKDICNRLDILSLEEKNGNIKLKKNDYYNKIMRYCK